MAIGDSSMNGQAEGNLERSLFAEQQFVGGGAYLFAAVLERFLGQYVSMNSFCQLLARTRQRKEVGFPTRPPGEKTGVSNPSSFLSPVGPL